MSNPMPITNQIHKTYKERLHNLLCTAYYEYYLELVCWKRSSGEPIPPNIFFKNTRMIIN